MIVSVHQPQYIPWLGYFDKIDSSDCFVYLDNVQYKRSEYQNRNKIRIKDGWLWLSVPVISNGLSRQKICDIKIEDDSVWRRKHLNSLKNWYRKAKFYKNYINFFEYTYNTHWDSLIDLNIHIIKFILEEFNIKTKIFNESQLDVNSQATQRIIDICKRLDADVYLSGTGGKEYLEEHKFKDSAIKLQYQEFNHPTYHQLYSTKNDFLPNMSIIDLLFNYGRESISIIRNANKRS